MLKRNGKHIIPNCPLCRRKMDIEHPKTIGDKNIYSCRFCNVVFSIRDVTHRYGEVFQEE
jgi:transposase-like protein